MFRRIARVAMLAAAIVAVGMPMPAHAQTGGTEAQPAPAAQRSRVGVVSSGGFSLSARVDALLGRPSAFRGTAPAEHAGRTVVLERLDLRTGAWTPATSAVIGYDGAFLARWRADRPGPLRMRARVQQAGGAQAASASPELGLTVYRPGLSTWYGPGLYGRRTACGQRMTRTLVGVAHRRLPCGTRVAVLYRGRTLTVPVVDRGPFRRNTTWDLTAAAARALGFTGTNRIGAVRLAQPSR